MLNELAAEMNTTNDYASMSVQANMIVIGVGIWELTREHICKPLLLGGSFQSTLNVTMSLMNQFLRIRANQNKHVTILWKTSGFAEPHMTPKTLEVNAAIMSNIDISKKSLVS